MFLVLHLYEVNNLPHLFRVWLASETRAVVTVNETYHPLLFGLIVESVIYVDGRENYQTHLYSIRYGGDKVEMNGDELSGLDGGTIFDSGTSFTYLVPEVYKTLLAVVSIDHIPCQ